MVKDYMALKKAEMNEKLQERDAEVERLEGLVKGLTKEIERLGDDPKPLKDMLQKVIDTIGSERLWTNPVRAVLAEAETLLR